MLKLLERVYVGLADWSALLALLPNLRKAKIVPDKEYEYFESKIYERALEDETVAIFLLLSCKILL